MSRFPDTVHFMGLNRPVRVEGVVRDLDIEGNLPPEIEGTFFRATPDRQFPPMNDRDVILSHDGMTAKLEIRNGHASYAVKFVETDRFKAERAAGRALFGEYRQPFTDDPQAEGVDRTVANTTPVWHGGRLLMTKEDGLPYQIDPVTLDTIGKFTFGGALKSQTMTAHGRIDPRTGEMFFFGYEAAGLASKTIAYCIADRNGNLVSEQWFEAPYCSMMHDFVITEKHAVFPVFPTTSELERMEGGGPHWIHEQERESWIGVMPRYGSVDEMVWIKGPIGVHSYHMMNAYAEGDLIHMDMCLFSTNMIPFIRDARGGEQVQTDGGFVRWTMDLSDPEAGVVERRMGPMGELPRVKDADQGREYTHGWYLTIDPTAGPLLAAGPGGVAFNCLVRMEVGNGGMETLTLPAYHAINEPVHIPAADPAHGGYLMAMIDRDASAGGENYKQEFWVLEADDIAKGPIAKIHVPLPGRPQVHGNWVSGALLPQVAN